MTQGDSSAGSPERTVGAPVPPVRSGPEPPVGAPVPPVDWAPWLWAAITLALVSWVYFPVLVFHPDPDMFALAEIWESNANYSYGYLIPPLAAYFAWERRHRVLELPLEGSRWGAVLVAGALCVFLVGLMGGVYFLARASSVLFLIGSLTFVAGWRWMRELAFPVLFLFLMIPIPNFLFIQIALPLQNFAAQVAEWALFTLEVPILRTGNVINLANTQLEVAEACSGLRSLFALVTTGVVFAYFFGRTAVQRVLIVLMAVPIAIVVNAARVAGTGWLAHSYGLEIATGYYHTMEGFAMFAIAFVLLAGVGFGTVALLPGPREATPPAEAGP